MKNICSFGKPKSRAPNNCNLLKILSLYLIRYLEMVKIIAVITTKIINTSIPSIIITMLTINDDNNY